MFFVLHSTLTATQPYTDICLHISFSEYPQKLVFHLTAVAWEEQDIMLFMYVMCVYMYVCMYVCLCIYLAS